MEQRVLVIEIEAKPEQAGKIYSGAADAEIRINEAIAEGWNVSQVYPAGQTTSAAVSFVVLTRG